MTDQELYDKIVKILGDHYGKPHDDYFGGTIDPQTVAQLIMDEVTEELNTSFSLGVDRGYDAGFLDAQDNR